MQCFLQLVNLCNRHNKEELGEKRIEHTSQSECHCVHCVQHGDVVTTVHFCQRHIWNVGDNCLYVRHIWNATMLNGTILDIIIRRFRTVWSFFWTPQVMDRRVRLPTLCKNCITPTSDFSKVAFQIQSNKKNKKLDFQKPAKTIDPWAPDQLSRQGSFLILCDKILLLRAHH